MRYTSYIFQNCFWTTHREWVLAVKCFTSAVDVYFPLASANVVGRRISQCDGALHFIYWNKTNKLLYLSLGIRMFPFVSPDRSDKIHTLYRNSLHKINRMFEIVILKRPLALVYSVLAGQPMTDGKAGLDCDWTLALRIGNDHEVLAHFTTCRNTDTVTVHGHFLCSQSPSYPDTHAHKQSREKTAELKRRTLCFDWLGVRFKILLQFRGCTRSWILNSCTFRARLRGCRKAITGG